MVSYYQAQRRLNGKTYGPYWWRSVYVKTKNGKKEYKKTYLGKNLVKGLIGAAKNDVSPKMKKEAEKSVQLKNAGLNDLEIAKVIENE